MDYNLLPFPPMHTQHHSSILLPQLPLAALLPGLLCGVHGAPEAARIPLLHPPLPRVQNPLSGGGRSSQRREEWRQGSSSFTGGDGVLFGTQWSHSVAVSVPSIQVARFKRLAKIHVVIDYQPETDKLEIDFFE